MDVSLLFFANRLTTNASAEYALLQQGAVAADQLGFRAVWMPERHFHQFGGAFPNPAITAAAIAGITERVRLRAGSVILPLHDPLQVAEDWAVVDNLSAGRVDVAVAPGWSANDFVTAPDRYAFRREGLSEGIDVLRRAWRGEVVSRVNGQGAAVDVAIQPRPVQSELPIWLTCAATAASFEMAGRMGLNVLTALLFQDFAALAENIALYRAARAAAGYQSVGIVTLMLHTFVHNDEVEARKIVRPVFLSYLLSSAELWKNELVSLQPRRRKLALEFAFLRYYERAGLMGSVDRCIGQMQEAQSAGVDEVAALVDFGLPSYAILDALPLLAEVQRATNCRLSLPSQGPNAPA